MRSAASFASSRIARKVATTKPRTGRSAVAAQQRLELDVSSRSSASITTIMRSRTVIGLGHRPRGRLRARSRSAQHAAQRLDQLRTGRPRSRARASGRRLERAPCASKTSRPSSGRPPSASADLLEALVLEQARDQLGARIAPFFLLVVRRRRQQHARLDPREGRRHHQVLAGDVEVQLAHQLEVLEVLLGDLRDRHVGDLELVLADQVQQQIERPLE